MSNRKSQIANRQWLRLALPTLLLGFAPGCGLATALFTPGPKPAKTEIVPGKSELSSEHEVQQPSRTRVVIRSERAPEQAASPAVRVKVTVGGSGMKDP